MPFGQAKQHVEQKIAPKIKESKSFAMKAAYDLLLDKFNSHTKKASEYIGHAKYKGHDKDKQDYLKQIKNSTKTFLEKKGEYHEFLHYSVNLDLQSDQLQNKIKEGIKQHEKQQYLDERKKNTKLIRAGNFTQAVKNLREFQKNLSPLNQVGTNKHGIKANLAEPSLELSLVIEKRIGDLVKEKKIFETYIKPGNTFDKGYAEHGYYIHDVDEQGNVDFSNYEYKFDRDNDGYALEGSGHIDYQNPQKMNWQDFYKNIATRAKLVRKFNHTQLVHEDIKEPEEGKEWAETMGQIAEIQLLKEINYVYSGKLEAQIEDPKKREALKSALEENYNSLRLFFQKDDNGIIQPTEVYRKCPQEIKVKKLLALKNGFKPLVENNLLKDSIDDEKDPKMKLFLEGELAFRNKSYMFAYGKIRKFIKGNEGNTKLKNEIAIAKMRLKKCSIYVLNFGYQSMTAYFHQRQGNEGNSMSKSYAKEMLKRSKALLLKLNKLIISGEAIDLHDALKKNPPNIAIFKKNNMDAMGLGDFGNNWDTYFKKIADIAAKTDREDQKNEILDLADDAREDGWTGPATSYYREYMRDGLNKRQKERNKSDDKWEA
ncbi:hypothetical protein ACFL3T_02680 [Patescibacteria group bacterium]